MQMTQCRLVSVTELTPIVKQVVLESDTDVDFVPGQYCQLVLGDNDKRPFSIANIADGSNRIELHMGVPPGNDYVQHAFDHLTTADRINVEVGLGKAFLRDRTMPTILLAGGTGFSYTWSILQGLLQQELKEPLFLYWGTRSLSDMYAFDALKALDAEHHHFTFVPVVEEASADWQGKTGWVHKAVMDDFTSLEPYQVYVAGRFEMAGVAREDFHQKGLLSDNLYGDAYEFI